jgi:hypothetical protein
LAGALDGGLRLKIKIAALVNSDRLPPLTARETNPDNSPDQCAKWWKNEKSDISKPADVGVTGPCGVYYRADEAHQCPNCEAGREMFSSCGFAMDFKATDFASAVSESIAV